MKTDKEFKSVDFKHEAQMKYIEIVSCPLCGNEDNKPFSFEEITIEGVSCRLGVNKCKKCSLVYTSPRLNSTGLTFLYDVEYKNAISGIYNIDFKNAEKEYLSSKKYVFELLPRGGIILDVGCGTGNFLSQFIGNDRYIAEGVEISKLAAKEAEMKGVKVQCGDIQNLHLSAEKYDVVSMLYVLEHVSNPVGLLKESYRLLKKGGYCLILVPNFNYLRLIYTGLLSSLFFRRKTYLHAEEHLQNFTPSTLLHTIKKAGFIPIKWGCASPINVGNRYAKIAKKTLSVVVHTLFYAGIHLGGIHLIVKKE